MFSATTIIVFSAATLCSPILPAELEDQQGKESFPALFFFEFLLQLLFVMWLVCHGYMKDSVALHMPYIMFFYYFQHTHTLSFSLSLSLSHTHTHTHTHRLALTGQGK